jgi:hypothetical protein
VTVYDHPPADDPSWPDDTHAVMFAAVGQRKYPVTVPVLLEGCERQCLVCHRWADADDWIELEARAALLGRWVACPECASPSPVAECAERDLIGLFTCVLPVPPRHEPAAFKDDAHAQAVNAIVAARAARRQARKHGFELA